MLEQLSADGLLAVIRTPDAEAARRTAHALVAGGLRFIELTLTTPEVLSIVEPLRDELPAPVMVGMGSVRTVAEAREAHAAGAEFLVSPHADPRVVEAMLATELPALPGALTPTEVAAVLSAGAQAIKLFPASTVGPGYVRSLRGPFPELMVIPTGGIGLDDLEAWFQAGVVAIGAGSELTKVSHHAAGDQLEVQAARWRAAVDRARSAPAA
jgi:2-dehydro-3-deoxyphosphogluconate aldolase / (4S)-4-hydroxy-2-oxoglutarate aldolase